ncbi:hypothetical protein JHK86_019365 [Glycine max]|nr:hypothetical protein JHK86_019365 [Glycine max]
MPRQVNWIRPQGDVIALNVDRSVLGNPQVARFGGLCRNHNGAFLLGFYGAVEISEVLYAEILALLKGLELCWEARYKKLVCYSDSLTMVNLVNNGVRCYHFYNNMIMKFHQLLGRDWPCSLNHTLRKGNQCADVLVKMGVASSSLLEVIYAPPLMLLEPLRADATEVVFLRL